MSIHRNHPRARLAPWVIGLAAILSGSLGHAQSVSMSGSYHESNGVLLDLPFNPPKVTCLPGSNDAQCHLHRQGFFGSPITNVREKPQAGVPGSAFVATANPQAVVLGGAVTIPTGLMSQMAGPQNQQFINNVVVYGETNFTYQLPAAARGKNPPAETRQLAARTFSPGNVLAHGQNNGLPITSPGYVYRANLNTTVSRTAASGFEQLTMRYSGGNGYGGTMAALIEGTGHLFLAGPGIDQIFPLSLAPVVGQVPIGTGPGNLRTQNGAGWDYTEMRVQPAGLFKAFPSAPSVVGPPCPATPPPTPGCNVVSGFDTLGIPLVTLPGATSTRHLFAWTTGTVSVVRTAIRQGITQTVTLTAMGYDTTALTSMGTAVQRNIGLVAGSYALRTDGAGGPDQLNPQLIGLDLEFIPEPGSTVALMSGLGLLGALGARRRR